MNFENYMCTSHKCVSVFVLIKVKTCENENETLFNCFFAYMYI